MVDLSTAAPSSTVRIHAALGARGRRVIDAGISGGAAAAEQGTLTIMAGGSAEALAGLAADPRRVQPPRLPHGSSGAGHTAKLLNNFLNGVSLAATAEVLVAARKAGLDLRTFLDVVNHSSGVNFATLNRFPQIVEGDYLEGGLTGNLMTKDVMLYVDLMRGARLPTLNAAGCIASFGLAAASATEIRSAIASSTQSGTLPAASACRTSPAPPQHERTAVVKINRGRTAGTTSELRVRHVHRRSLGRLGARERTRGAHQRRVLRAGRAHALAHPRARTDLAGARRPWLGAAADGEGGEIVAGDVVWISPGEEHWHGADGESFLLHRAISLGVTDWLDEVAAREYDDSVKRTSLPQT